MCTVCVCVPNIQCVRKSHIAGKDVPPYLLNWLLIRHDLCNQTAKTRLKILYFHISVVKYKIQFWPKPDFSSSLDVCQQITCSPWSPYAFLFWSVLNSIWDIPPRVQSGNINHYDCKSGWHRKDSCDLHFLYERQDVVHSWGTAGCLTSPVSIHMSFCAGSFCFHVGLFPPCWYVCETEACDGPASQSTYLHALHTMFQILCNPN